MNTRMMQIKFIEMGCDEFVINKLFEADCVVNYEDLYQKLVELQDHKLLAKAELTELSVWELLILNGNADVFSSVLHAYQLCKETRGLNDTNVLHWAVRSGSPAMVKEVLGLGINVNSCYFRYSNERKSVSTVTAVHDAAKLGDTAMLKLLRKAGANLNAISSAGERPLTEAFFAENYFAMQWLLRHGATVTNRVEIELFNAAAVRSEHQREYLCCEAWMSIQLGLPLNALNSLLIALADVDDDILNKEPATIANQQGWYDSISACLSTILDYCRNNNRAFLSEIHDYIHLLMAEKTCHARYTALLKNTAELAVSFLKPDQSGCYFATETELPLEDSLSTLRQRRVNTTAETAYRLFASSDSVNRLAETQTTAHVHDDKSIKYV